MSAALRCSGYDTAGNIRSITKDGTVTKSFGYTNPSWPDLLTSVTANGTTKDVLYEGQSQTSDLPSSGNPVTYYNGRDYHFDWSKGRQLTDAVVGGQTVKYAYDMAGVRRSKQVGDTTYTYTTLSGKVMRQQWGNKSLEFVYDDGNQPFAMIYKHGSEAELYYYLVNAQGDVAAILDSSGTMVASYNYGAWGSCTVYNSSDAAIGDLNPLRYRGYYYDAETGFYYLQSRYYDPAICRFINADAYATTNAGSFLSCNMFAYCENNPIMWIDPTGHFLSEIIGFFKTAVDEIGKAVGALSPIYAGCGGVAIADGPLPFGDAVGIVGAVLLTAGAIGYGIYQAAKAPTTSVSKEKDIVKPPSSTVIYRYGGTNPGNLTPRAKDRYTGLSFSTVPMPGAAMTTIEALNATGVVYAVRDGATHVSVRPVGGTMDDWISAGSNSVWTQAVKSVVIKWDGAK